MHSALRRRIGAPLLLLVFALFWGESFARASCPMHDAVSQQGGGSPAARHAGIDAHAAHAMHAHHALSADGAPARDSAPPPHGCNCLGDCAGSTPLALYASQEPDLSASPIREGVTSLRATSTVALRGQTRLPFAHAPPHARLA